MRIIDWSSDVCSSDLRVSTTSRVARRRRQLFYRPVDVENSLFDRGVLDVVQVFFKRTVLHHLAMGGRIRAQLIACHRQARRMTGIGGLQRTASVAAAELDFAFELDARRTKRQIG